MAIYFLRHGQSEANKGQLFAGSKNDSPLSPLGRAQALQAGQGLASVQIDRIISSKLTRAFATAVIVAGAIGFPAGRIETDDRILVYDVGSLVNSAIRKIGARELAATVGAESPALFRQRVLSFLTEHRDSSQNVLMVTHTGVGQAIEAAKTGMAPEDLFTLERYPNAMVMELGLDWLPPRLEPQ